MLSLSLPTCLTRCQHCRNGKSLPAYTVFHDCTNGGNSTPHLTRWGRRSHCSPFTNDPRDTQRGQTNTKKLESALV